MENKELKEEEKNEEQVKQNSSEENAAFGVANESAIENSEKAQKEVKKSKKKKITIAISAVLTAVIVLGMFFGIYSLAVIYGSTTITLNTEKTYQTMEGFGASSAWIYQDFGKLDNEELKSQAMEMLYGDSGLALNTFRYNISGGGAEVYQYDDVLRGGESFFKTDVAKSIMDGTKDYSEFKDIQNYDFTKDAAVQSLFEEALNLGNIDSVVFFANSPHYAMTVNGLTHGTTEHFNNHKEDAYEAFSDYLLIITDYLTKTYIQPVEEKFGKDIKVYISPVNEPQWTWGGPYASQEGCHYDPKPLAKFYQQFYTSLNAYNNSNDTDFKMDIFECGKYMMVASSANVNEYMTEFEKYPFFDSITNISAHSYGADTSKFYRTLYADYMDKYYSDLSISITEYCVLEFGIDPSIDMGLFSAKVIMRDLTMLDAVSWNYWLSISKGDYEDGLIYWNKDSDGKDILNAYKRYYAMGHFSKYIPDGSVRIEASYSDTLGFNGVECVAYQRPDGSIAMVVINDSERSHKINIKGGYKNIEEVLTTEEENWKTSEYKNGGSITIPSKSIATYIFTK